MSLNNINLKLQYRSDRDNMIEDFYNPCMAECTSYDRAVGYFTSSSLSQAAKGIEKFIQHKGHMRLIASPKLLKEDIEAINNGLKAKKQVIQEAILRELVPSEDVIKNNRIAILSWLVYKGHLEIKIAVLKKNQTGIYHEKFGVFRDSNGNKVGFTGSANETEGGYCNNFESIDVYFSTNERDKLRIEVKERDFRNLWDNATEGLDVIEFPEAAKKKFLEFKDVVSPEWKCWIPTSLHDTQDGKPCVPSYLDIREYQKDAVKAWIKNNCMGILEMATGTGKTITSLFLATKVYEKLSRLCIIIVCPYQHLVTQWNSEAQQFNIKATLCFDSKNIWQPVLREEINNFNMNLSDYLCVITTNSTFCTSAFSDMLKTIKNPALIIFDEAHHVGTDNFDKYLPQNIELRLGLSATPERWFDDKGNGIINSYFKNGVVYSYPLEKAIGKFLTDYYYHPHIVYFTDEESDEYMDLSVKISKCFSSDIEDISLNDNPYLKTLLIQRAKLVSRAENKILKLKECLVGKENTKYNLFYTGDAKVDGERQIEKVIKMLGHDLGMKVHPFTSEESKEQRKEILDLYETGQLQGLVAIKCLDEGVNVPLIQTAYILASSSNPREFIQRRGRVLRKHKLKDFSYIHDFIVVPSNMDQIKNLDDKVFNIERKLMMKEVIRVKEFCKTALNGPQAEHDVFEVKKMYNLLHI